MLPQSEVKGSALANLAFCPDFTSVPSNDSLDRGQADSVAGKFFRGVEALERLEEAIGGSRIESDAVVAHEVDGNLVLALDAEFDFRRGLLGGVLPGVAEEIIDH